MPDRKIPASRTPDPNAPDWKPEILRRLAPLRLSPARETEIAEELAQHLDDRYQELLAASNANNAASAHAATLAELDREDLLALNLSPVERDLYRGTSLLPRKPR